MTGPSAPRLIGRDDELAALAAAFDAARHVLVEGPHGVGKSLVIGEICTLRGAAPVVVHGSVALSASALVGAHDPGIVLRGGHEVAFVPGPLVYAMRTGRVLYLDEANRVPADVINVLISAMSEAELVVPRYGRVLAKPGFQVVAAVNPLDGIGTGTLPAAFLDRLVRLTLDYQSAEDERAIVRTQVPDADDALLTRAIFAVRASRRHPDVRTGASVRGAIDLVSIAPFLVQLGRLDADLDAALLALSSKIALRSGIERTVESLIRELWTDAVINEHRATTGPRPDGAAGEPLLLSSVELEREGDGGAEEPAYNPAAAKPGRAAARTQASAGGTGSGSPGADPGGAHESDVTAETRQALASFVRSSRGRSRSGGARTDVAAAQDLTDVERLAAGIVVNRARGQLPTADRTGGRFTSVRYNFRSDDLDLDRTIAELIETPVLTPSHLWVHDRVPRRRGVVVMLDVSGSMRGGRAIESATAAASAALAAEQDELAVVAFGTSAEVLKRSEETMPVQELARRVLALRPHGLTDLSAGLGAGLRLLAGMQSLVKIAVVMTDGVQNQGADARVAAARYRQLNVLATTESQWRLGHCQALAAAGRGRCLSYERLDRLPAAISVLLSG
ncbi:MAG TPA: AAA family ATPase [Jatrophihabitantaceae bacterium]|jgi:MoxR-like ATPase/Mg-chelatase subunit ChlD